MFSTLRAQLRILSTTATAIAAGLMTTITRSEPAAAVSLRPGDPALEFALLGFGSRTYCLSDVGGGRSISLSSVQLRSSGAACFAVGADDGETNRRCAAYLGNDLPILSDPDTVAALTAS
ncbi:MAG TPA: hypothetical protein VH417_03655 [Vicinamibacterales bacterium]